MTGFLIPSDFAGIVHVSGYFLLASPVSSVSRPGQCRLVSIKYLFIFRTCLIWSDCTGKYSLRPRSGCTHPPMVAQRPCLSVVHNTIFSWKQVVKREILRHSDSATLQDLHCGCGDVDRGAVLVRTPDSSSDLGQSFMLDIMSILMVLLIIVIEISGGLRRRVGALGILAGLSVSLVHMVEISELSLIILWSCLFAILPEQMVDFLINLVLHAQDLVEGVARQVRESLCLQFEDLLVGE